MIEDIVQKRFDALNKQANTELKRSSLRRDTIKTAAAFIVATAVLSGAITCARSGRRPNLP